MIALMVLMFFCFSAQAGDPHSAYYSSENNKIFWFIHITDIHIGVRGTQDSNNLQWVVNEGKNVINPSFIVASGDLTDSTNGNILGWPDGPHQVEWDEYKAILNAAGMDSSFYYDIPGNHDAYNDANFNYFINNAIQGMATGQAQASWTREFDFGKYHFIGTNTGGNDGRSFSIFFPYGDYAGLDSNELTFIETKLQEHTDSELTLVFGHHPMDRTEGVSGDTWIFYGTPEFANLMESYGISSYGYGHTHQFTEKFFTQGEDYETGQTYFLNPGIFYINIDSLGKSSNNHLNVTAIDCNGIATVSQAINTWPIVLITAPMDLYLGGAPNPYAYSVPNSNTNPIRALVFDSNTVTLVQYRIDGTASWSAMTSVTGNPHLWEGVWDASAASGGNHTIEVQATSNSGTRTDLITVEVGGCSTDPDCDDGLYCNGEETCVAGTCQNGTSVDCSDGIGCTDDACNEASDACDNVPNNDNCDDGVFCNGVEICDASNDCLAGTPVTCLDDSLFCTGDEICDEVSDACISTGNPCQEGDICNDDQDVCEGSSCSNPNGVCEEGEDCSSCPSDCISSSGGGSCDACFKDKCDGICNPKKETSDCSDCVPSYCCGDSVCEGIEDGDNCAIDCGAAPFCGDGNCDGDENSCNCPGDCGAPPPTETSCTDGVDNDCDGATDCYDSADCGSDPACECLLKGSVCTDDSDCCSNKCRGGKCR
jgi:hypothetical protein